MVGDGPLRILRLRVEQGGGQYECDLRGLALYGALTPGRPLALSESSAGAQFALQRSPQGPCFVKAAVGGIQHNGQPLTEPRALNPGDWIDAFGARIQVVGWLPAAEAAQVQTTQTGTSTVDLPATSGARPQAGQRFDRYQLLELLGEGQYGSVFRAHDPKLDREVAVKVLIRSSERARQRFLREINTTARLTHPHLITIHDSGEQNGQPFLVMEYLKGSSLADLSDDEPLDPTTAARWVAQAARGIDFAHQEGVVHRDIKPHNIVVDEQGKARVLDFGIASLRESGDDPRLTHEGAAPGTPAYMAPELSFGAEASVRSDIYGLGATLLHIVTGRVPSSGSWSSGSAVLHGIPRALEPVFARAMADDSEERYPSAAALADDLDRFVDHGSIRTSRAPLLTAAVVLLAVGGAGAGWIATRGEPPAAEGAHAAKTPAPAEPVPGKTTAPRADSPVAPQRTGLAQVRFLRRRRRSSEALAAAQALLKSAQGRAALEARYELALALSDLGRRERALATLEALARDDPQGAIGANAGALLHLLLGDRPGAELRAREASRREPNDVEAQINLGLALTQTRPQRAADLLRAVTRAHGDATRALLGIAEALCLRPRDRKQLRAGAQAADRVLALTAPRHAPLALLLRGEAHHRLRELEKAANLLTRAERADRAQSVRALILRGLARGEMGQQADARADWREALWRDGLLFDRELASLSEPARARVSKGAAYAPVPPLRLRPLSPELTRRIDARVARAPANARTALRTALGLAAGGASYSAIAPHLSKLPLEERARLLVGRDRYDEALQVIEEAGEKETAAHEMARLAAEVWLRRGQVRTALSRYQALAREDPQGVEGLCAAAEVAWLQNRKPAALAAAKRALALDPKHAGGLLVKGITLIYMSRPEQALKVLDRAVRLHGALNARLLMMRAVAAAELFLARKRTPKLHRATWIAALRQFERLRHITRGVSPRLLGAKYAMKFPGIELWVGQILREARALEPRRAGVFAALAAEAQRRRGARQEVVGFWRRVRALEPGAPLPKAARESFLKVYGAPGLEASLRR